MDSIFLSPQIGKKVFSQKISLPFFKEWQTFKGQLIPVNSRKTGDNGHQTTIGKLPMRTPWSYIPLNFQSVFQVFFIMSKKILNWSKLKQRSELETK